MHLLVEKSKLNSIKITQIKEQLEIMFQKSFHKLKALSVLGIAVLLGNGLNAHNPTTPNGSIPKDNKISFIQNDGQWISDAKYKAEVPGGAMFLTNEGFVYNFMNFDDLDHIHTKTCGTDGTDHAPTGKEIIPVKQKSKVFWRYNLPLKQMLYSGFHVSEANIKYYISSLNKFKPLVLDGFPSSMYRIARYISMNNIKLEFQPIAIFPTAETLHDYYREEIEKAFNCSVRNQYASSEGAPFITECQQGRLHFNIETGYFNLKEYNNESN